MNDLYLVHHGVRGMKWGQRRYQLETGERTTAGEKKHRESMRRSRMPDRLKKGAVGAAKIVGAAVVAYGGFKLAKIALKHSDISEIKSLLVGSFKEDASKIVNTIKKIPANKIIGKTASVLKGAGKVGLKVAKPVGRFGIKSAKAIGAGTINALKDENKRRVMVGAGITAGSLYAVKKANDVKDKVKQYANGEVRGQTRAQRIGANAALTYLNPRTWMNKPKPTAKERIKKEISNSVRSVIVNSAKERAREKFFKRKK